MNALDRATWTWITNWTRSHENPGAGFSIREHLGLAEDIHATLAKDPGQQRIAALALSELMRTPFVHMALPQDFAFPQDYLAAVLYRDWNLPAGPAESLLADPQTSLRARRLAIIALERYWGTRSFQQKAIGGLCILAAQISGLAHLADSVDIDVLADEDQLDFLNAVLDALVAAHEEESATSVGADAVLPPGQVITAYVHRRLCRALGCKGT